MKNIYYILSLICLCSCNRETLRDRFDTLMAQDYSEFENVCVINRGGTYLIIFDNSNYIIAKKESFFSNQYYFITSDRNHTIVNLPEKEKNKFNAAIRFLRSFNLLEMEVNNTNSLYIDLTFYWKDDIGYSLIKLSNSESSQEILSLPRFKTYKSLTHNWYWDPWFY